MIAAGYSNLYSATRHLAVAVAVTCAVLLAQTDDADAQMGGGRGSGGGFNSGMTTKQSGGPQFGQKAPTTGTNKANPTPVKSTRDHRGEEPKSKPSGSTVRPCRGGWGQQGGACDRYNRPIQVRDHRKQS